MQEKKSPSFISKGQSTLGAWFKGGVMSSFMSSFMGMVMCTVMCTVMCNTSDAAAADNYPNRPVTMIVAFPAGGGTDIVARKIAQRLSALWGKQVIVDNKGGAAGVIGTTFTAKAEPNGYTLMMATLGNLTMNQFIYPMEINPVKALTPITNVVGVNFVLVAHPSFPANTVKEMIALGKQKPGQYNYASSGSGGAPHLAIELFKNMTGTYFVHIPYKGSGPSIADLLAGQVSFTMDSLVQTLPYIQSGQLKAIAVLGPQRSALLPKVPTVAESGAPGYEFVNWFGLVAPQNTPADIVAKIRADVSTILSQPDMAEQLNKMGADVINNSSEQYGAQIAADAQKWEKIIKLVGVKLE